MITLNVYDKTVTADSKQILIRTVGWRLLVSARQALSPRMVRLPAFNDDDPINSPSIMRNSCDAGQGRRRAAAEMHNKLVKFYDHETRSLKTAATWMACRVCELLGDTRDA